MDSWEPHSTELTTEEDTVASRRKQECGRERRHTQKAGRSGKSPQLLYKIKLFNNFMFKLMAFFSQEGWWPMAGEDGCPNSRTESEFAPLLFIS